MFDYFKNIAEKNSCQSIGVCSVHPSVTSLYEILLAQLRDISYYLVKLKEFGFLNNNIMDVVIETLSTFLINTSFNQSKYLSLIKKLQNIKEETKEKYTNYCSVHKFPYEVINCNLKIDDKTTISELINYSQNTLMNKQKNCDRKKQRLFELITLQAKLCAINIVKIKKLDKNFNDFDYDVIRFFALTNGYSIRDEKIIRRIKEFSNISAVLKEKLDSIYKEKYGNKESASILTNPQKGHSILVSGDDLDELEHVLKALEEYDPKTPINVYTNGALILAHFYPYFKNNKFLKGHLGKDNTEYEFSIFPGSILITKNFIQKIDTLYRGEIFSNKLISFEKVFDIENDNYEPLISSCLNIDGFNKNQEKKYLKITYDIKEIEKTLENIENEEVILIAGKPDDNYIGEYKNKKIITFNYPLEEDILIKSIKYLKEKNIKTTIFFSQCNLSSIDAILSLLNEEINIYLAQCSSLLINPHVIEALKEDFMVNII